MISCFKIQWHLMRAIWCCKTVWDKVGEDVRRQTLGGNRAGRPTCWCVHYLTHLGEVFDQHVVKQSLIACLQQAVGGGTRAVNQTTTTLSDLKLVVVVAAVLLKVGDRQLVRCFALYTS